MALEESVQRYTYEANGAIDQYILVSSVAGSPRTCKIAGAADALLIGATLNKATAAGQALAVGREGIIKVKASAPITAGAIVASAAGGKAVAAAAGFGVAITAAAGVDEVIEVQWGGKVG
jgi:hypothetical protein